MAIKVKCQSYGYVRFSLNLKDDQHIVKDGEGQTTDGEKDIPTNIDRQKDIPTNIDRQTDRQTNIERRTDIRPSEREKKESMS